MGLLQRLFGPRVERPRVRCVDCEHHRPVDFGHHHDKCDAVWAPGYTNHVTGETRERYRVVCRLVNRDGRCAHFDAKEVETDGQDD